MLIFSFFKKKSQKAFTLIELLVVIAIIGIVSSSVFLVNRGSSEEIKLKRAVEQLAQDLAEMREFALGAKALPCKTKPETSNVSGVNFKNTSDLDDLGITAWNKQYRLFIDCNSNSEQFAYGGQDGEIKRVYLPAGVKIKSLDPKHGNRQNIVFIPPEPTVVFENESPSKQQVTITLCLVADSNIEKKVIINKAGKIEIQ